LRCIPNITISSPKDEEDLRNLMYTAQLPGKGTFAIRYPRGSGIMPDWKTPFKEIQIGKARILKEGSDIAILSIGAIGNLVSKIYDRIDLDEISIAHYDMRFVKPLDEELLHQIFKRFDKIITIEDGTMIGGFGTAVLEFMVENQYNAKIKRLGVPDKFIEQGTQAELYKECGYDEDGIYQSIIKLSGFKKEKNSKSIVA
jgi:1-deoxy-D-xylulose-5-phosphate synthase